MVSGRAKGRCRRVFSGKIGAENGAKQWKKGPKNHQKHRKTTQNAAFILQQNNPLGNYCPSKK